MGPAAGFPFRMPTHLRLPAPPCTLSTGGTVSDSRKTLSAWKPALKRAALYFLGLDLLAFFYYLVGNSQEFLAATQILLLRAVSVLSAAAFLSGLAGLSFSAARWIRRSERVSLPALAGWIACMASAVVLALVSQSVRAFASGI